MTRSRLCVAVVVVVAGLVGPLGLSRLSASTPPGYVRVKVKKVGISVVVPDDWQLVSYTRKEARQRLERNPGMRSAGITVDSLTSTPFGAGRDADGDGFVDQSLEVSDEARALVLPAPDALREQLEAEGKPVFQNVTVQESRVAGRPALLSETDQRRYES